MNSFYDERCDELEVWLRERGYSYKLVGHKIIKARKHKRVDLLNHQRRINNDCKLVLNITYHQNISNLKGIMSCIFMKNHPQNGKLVPKRILKN